MPKPPRDRNVRRPFTLLDGMIVVAAVALEFGLLGALELDKWRLEAFLDAPALDTLPLLITALRPFFAATGSAFAFALLGFRLAGVRSSARRFAVQPGLAATLAVGLAWLLATPWVAFYAHAGGQAIPIPLIPFSVVMVTWVAGFGVAVRWILMALTRRCRVEPSWVDRLGRLVGMVWLLLFASLLLAP